MKPCRHSPPRDGCRLCWLAEHDPRYQAAWGLPVTAGRASPPRVEVKPLTLRPPCVHEGAVLEWCQTCGSDIKHVRDCDLHERCTRIPVGNGVRACLDCPDYRSSAQTSPRHLLFHVYPVRGNGVWQLNLDRLRPRLPLFDGRRILAIATDARTDEAAVVRDHLAGERVEWIEVTNDPALREMRTWPLLWERLQGQAGAVFFGHAKGTTRPANAGTTIHRWADLLYRLNLDHWPQVEALLGTHPIAGAFKKGGRGFRGSASAWHFSGSFYWARLDAVGDRWRRGDVDRWFGVESWPGLHWSAAEAGCHFGAGQVRTLDLYKMSVLRHWEKEYETWKSAITAAPSRTG